MNGKARSRFAVEKTLFIRSFFLFYFFYKVFSTVQGSVLPTDQDIVGIEAEVITAIPGHEQLGEVAYVAKGVRMNAPARSEDGTQIPAHTAVVVSKIVGTTTYVKPVRR